MSPNFYLEMKYFLSFVTLCLGMMFSATAGKDTRSSKDFTPIQKLGYAERVIETFYVDTVDGESMVEEAIVAMLKTLDPHSTYSDAKETKELTTPLQGNFSGIGIQFNMVNDTLYVIQTTVGGPSEKVGIQPGDRLLVANDSVLSGAKRQNSDILNILRGPKGTEVLVDVLRKGVEEPIRFRIIRDEIPINSVDASYVINDAIGYVKISRFAEKTANEVEEALRDFKKKGIKDIIVDLQDNGGGYLNAAVELASLFLPENSLIVYTDGPRIKRTDYYVEGKPIMPDGRLVVLVNQNSASSSEIFAGAIQDNDRGVIVGRRTFGKGLVQRPFPFPDGSMIRLTVSRYYTPSGRSIQKPYEKGEEKEYYLDIYNRYKNGEFLHADSIHFNDDLKTFTLNHHRTVYGGGGIMPDIFVPIDTTGNSKYYRDLMAGGIINRMVVEYVDEQRDSLKQAYPTMIEFIEGFTVSEELLQRLVALGEKENIAFDETGMNESRKVIESILKGLIARDLWDMTGYYETVNPVLNPIYRNGIEIISDYEHYDDIISPSN